MVKRKKRQTTYLNCQTCAELIAHMTIRPTRGQNLLLNLAEGGVELSGVVRIKPRVLHTLECHSSHGIGICDKKTDQLLFWSSSLSRLENVHKLPNTDLEERLGKT